MTRHDDELDARVGAALRAEVDDLHAGPELLDRIERRLGEPEVRRRAARRAPWLAAAAVLVVLGALGALGALGRSDPASVTAGAPDGGGVYLPTSVPEGYELVDLERAVAGGHVGSPLSPRRVDLLEPGEGGHAVLADWVGVPSALAVAPGTPMAELEGGTAATVADVALGDGHSEVRWTGTGSSGWLTSVSAPASDLLELAQRFVAEGALAPPEGFEVVAVHDDRAASVVRYRSEDGGTSAATVELFTYPSTLDVAAQQRIAAAQGTSITEVDVGGAVGLASEGRLVWSLYAGVTVRLQASDLSLDALVALAESVAPASEERWSTAARSVGADPRPFAWRNVAAGVTGEGGGWLVARRDPVDGPGCTSLFVFEVGGGGPPSCDATPTVLAPMVAARVPSAAVAVELVTGAGVIDAEVHPIDADWSVAVGDAGDLPVQGTGSDVEVRAVDAAGDPVG